MRTVLGMLTWTHVSRLVYQHSNGNTHARKLALQKCKRQPWPSGKRLHSWPTHVHLTAEISGVSIQSSGTIVHESCVATTDLLRHETCCLWMSLASRLLVPSTDCITLTARAAHGRSEQTCGGTGNPELSAYVKRCQKSASRLRLMAIDSDSSYDPEASGLGFNGHGSPLKCRLGRSEGMQAHGYWQYCLHMIQRGMVSCWHDTT